VRSIPLRGKGAPTAELSPGPLEFPITKKNTSSMELEETFRNVGLEPLAISSVAIAGENAADFAIASESCTYSPVGPQATCYVRVRFTPQADGFRNAYLTFASNVFDAP